MTFAGNLPLPQTVLLFKSKHLCSFHIIRQGAAFKHSSTFALCQPVLLHHFAKLCKESHAFPCSVTKECAHSIEWVSIYSNPVLLVFYPTPIGHAVAYLLQKYTVNFTVQENPFVLKHKHYRQTNISTLRFMLQYSGKIYMAGDACIYAHTIQIVMM